MTKLKSVALRNVRKTSEQVRKDQVKKSKKQPIPRRTPSPMVPAEAPVAPSSKKGKKKQQQPSSSQKTKQPRLELQEESSENYGSLEYWEARHSKDDDYKEKFEWFLSYDDLKPILAQTKPGIYI